MDNLKNDAYYLDKIKSDLKFVIDHTSGKTKAEFEKDEVLVDCVMFRIIQIAENCNKLSEAFQTENIKVPLTFSKRKIKRKTTGWSCSERPGLGCAAAPTPRRTRERRRR